MAHREMRMWDGGQVATFLESVDGQRLSALWVVAFGTGMRRGELLGLRWRDVDLDGRFLSVQQQRVRGIDGVGYGAPKTAKGRRRISLDAATVAALRSHRARQREEHLALGLTDDRDALVFDKADAEPLDGDVISQSFAHLATAAGLEPVRFHDIRHTHATILLAAGFNPKVVSERLGHASITITLDTYSHVLPTLQEDAADRFAAAIRAV